MFLHRSIDPNQPAHHWSTYKQQNMLRVVPKASLETNWPNIHVVALWKEVKSIHAERTPERIWTQELLLQGKKMYHCYTVHCLYTTATFCLLPRTQWWFTVKHKTCYLLQTDLIYWVDLWYRAAMPFSIGLIERPPKNGEMKITKPSIKLGFCWICCFGVILSLILHNLKNIFSRNLWKELNRKTETVQNILIAITWCWNRTYFQKWLSQNS